MNLSETMIILVIFYYSILATSGLKNNVCRTWKDYDRMDRSPNCFHNPDVNSNTADIVRRKGYSIQSHDVNSDGYIITMFRIGKPKESPKGKQPVFLLHGMGADSTFWVMFSNRSLAFYLVEDGYDVWLGNVRGNTYGRVHTNYTIRDPKFWDFSIDDIGLRDLPQQIKYIQWKTGNTHKILLVGHSMGTTAAFMYASEKNIEAKKNLLTIMALAPSAYLNDMYYLKNIVPIALPMSRSLERMYSILGLNVLSTSEFVARFINSFCTGSSVRTKFCWRVTSIAFGNDEEQFLPEDIPLLVSYAMAGVSVKCVMHYLQISGNNRFQKYDNGKIENMKLYGTTTPPEYKLGDIRVPVHLFAGKNDTVTTYSNVKRLYADLKSKKSLTFVSEDDSVRFNHIGYVAAKDTVELFFKPFFKMLNDEVFDGK